MNSFIKEKLINDNIKKKSNKSSLKTDNDFWDDCLIDSDTEYKKSKFFKFQNSSQSTSRIKSISNSNSKFKIKNLKKSMTRSTTFSKNAFKIFIEKYPQINKDLKENKIENIKRRKAQKRCISLYNYSFQQNYFINSIYNENLKKKNQEELDKCTWKPKINKINKKIRDSIQSLGKDIYQREKVRKKNKTRHLSKEYEKYDNNPELKEYTFRPKLINNNLEKIDKMFNKNKSIISDRENAEFIYRYMKARDERMIKRFIELSVKDESYDNSYIAILNRNYDQKYKDKLNVNCDLRVYGKKKINNKFYSDNNTSRKYDVNKYLKKPNYVENLRRSLNDIELDEPQN